MHRISSRRFLVPCLSVLLAGSASAQTLLDQLVARVMKPHAGPASTATTTGTTPAAALAGLTPAQGAAIDRALATPVADPRVAADRQAAAPLIRSLVATGACARTGRAFDTLVRQMVTPENLDGFLFAAMPKLRFHDRATCLDVVRVTDWRKPALNALAFTAYYVAADSGEAQRQGFVVQRVDGSGWLIRTVEPTGE